MAEVPIKAGHTEIRVQVPNELVAVLDAKSLSLGIVRNRYVIRILRERAISLLEAHIVMGRVLQGNPDVFQSSWKDSEKAALSTE